MGEIVQLWRYPVKSARGQRLRQVQFGTGGVAGDRRWACVDVGDETVASAKHPGRWGRLLDVGARLDDQDVCWVSVAGRTCAAGTPEAEQLLGEYLGRRVRLTRTMPDRPRIHRLLPEEPGMLPEWMAAARPGQELVTELPGDRPGGGFVDFGAVHVITTGALSRLARELGRDGLDATVFRPNVVIDAAGDPEPGTELRLGDAVLRVQFPTPRCVLPGIRRGADPPIDRPLLGALARRYRRTLPGLGAAACFGTYAEILRPGLARVGQPVQAVGA